MNADFSRDPFPGRPRILFIGFPESSHTQSWIDLLADGSFNVRLFGLPSAAPPNDWAVKTYLTSSDQPFQDSALRRTVFPPIQTRMDSMAFLARGAANHSRLQRYPRVRKLLNLSVRASERLGGVNQDLASIEGALAHVIREWRPHVIHTLGFDPASYLYLRARKIHGIEGIGRWVAQARGGPDLALQRFSEEFRPRIEEVLATCDHFIADNQPNYDYALSTGMSRNKIESPGMGVVSGAGGMDIDGLRAMWTDPPSRREPVIVWTKAYETYTAKAMPVFEAIVNYWDLLQPCRIEMLWMVQSDVHIWYNKMLPDHIKASCPTFGRLSRAETLERVAKARVMMAPSLSDGIPNAMMEAMALGAAPLVSPLDTITPVVESDRNVVFARNLYPDEIGQALVRLMRDDALVDNLAYNNIERIRNLSDRRQIMRRALGYYEDVATLCV